MRQLYLTCFLLGCLLGVIPSIHAKPLDTDSLAWSQLVERHQAEFRELLAQNQLHEKRGQAHLNRYIFGDLEYFRVYGRKALIQRNKIQESQLQELQALLSQVNQYFIDKEISDGMPRPRAYMQLTGFSLGLLSPTTPEEIVITDYGYYPDLSPAQIFQSLERTLNQSQEGIEEAQYATYAQRLREAVMQQTQGQAILLVNFSVFLKIKGATQSPQVHEKAYLGISLSPEIRESYHLAGIGTQAAQALKGQVKLYERLESLAQLALDALSDQNRKSPEEPQISLSNHQMEIIQLVQAEGRLAIDRSLKSIVSIFDGAKIPESVWNPAHPSYALRVLNAEQQVSLALAAGIYNQVLDEAKGLPELGQLLVHYIGDAEFRKEMHAALAKLGELGTYQRLAGQTGKHFQSLAQLDAKSAYLVGQDVVILASLGFGLKKFANIKGLNPALSSVRQSGDKLAQIFSRLGQKAQGFLIELRKKNWGALRQEGDKLAVYANHQSQVLLARIENGLIRLLDEIDDITGGKLLDRSPEMKVILPNGQVVSTRVEVWQKGDRVYMKGEGGGKGKKRKLDQGIKLSSINSKNFEELFKDITDEVTKSGCNSNCTVVSISVAKKILGQDILSADKFKKAFVGDGEDGLAILNEYVDLVPKDMKMPNPFPNPFSNRMLFSAERYRAGINNKVLVERLFARVPNGTTLVFASYKGMNKSDFTGHAFNVIKDENGLIKFIDIQLKNKLEYGEGIEALVAKMKNHGLENSITKESSNWYFYDASSLKK